MQTLHSVCVVYIVISVIFVYDSFDQVFQYTHTFFGIQIHKFGNIFSLLQLVCDHGMALVVLLGECGRFRHSGVTYCITQRQLVDPAQPRLSSPLGDDVVVLLEFTVHNLGRILLLVGFEVQIVFAGVNFQQTV